MCNGNIYKGFCAVFMVLVMIFCGGINVYAANGRKLEKAEDAVDKNPTIENLEYLCKIYEKNVKYYK